MSFLDDIGLGGAANFVTGGMGGLVSIALTGLALNQVTRAMNSGNTATTAPDFGKTQTVPPAISNYVPVVYGQGWAPGIVTDIAMTNNQRTMTFVLTICEQTGTLLSTGQASQLAITTVYWNDLQLAFNPDGITVQYGADVNGNVDTSMADRVRVWCYSGSSDQPVSPTGYTNNSLQPAYSVMPGWTASKTMDQLIFAVVELTYDKTRGVTALGKWNFEITNTMTQPGDCLYDYMTNTRYGVGIDPGAIQA
jgi:hypothetical protein